MGFKPVKVAAIGSGNISYTYLNTLSKEWDIIELVGCSDLVPEKSAARAELFGIRQMTTEEILADPEIEIVLNLTEIHNHTKVTRMALEAGKNVYSEKALGCSFEEALANVKLAEEKGLRLGSAPDIYLGAAYQTARKLIDDGWIGDPVTAQAWCIRGYGAHNRPGMRPDGAVHGQAGTTITFDVYGNYDYKAAWLRQPRHRLCPRLPPPQVRKRKAPQVRREDQPERRRFHPDGHPRV